MFQHLEDPEAGLREMLRVTRYPHSGTRLRGMFVRAGLVDIEQAVKIYEITHPDFVQMTFLHDRLDMAIAAGDITRDEADRFAAALADRHRDGTFFADAFGYNVAGTKVQRRFIRRPR